ncbi:predicted protein [Naegleria gruberi]|uniref:Predicted protein n=1 Tax=Naegleria gruberi TaxID=5762 RepID=D2VNK3_NAEGR|nr:uncharacterized protein NAEGRDRAFT_70531 [Naegleria gruberi]EFC41750.1 predicted protein [Naegleria gruberi]|eukprot:XP_002674494.1 predicted protein [Naegleria gruberi strain NEG-M]
MFVAKLEFRPLPNNNLQESIKQMYSLKWAYPNDLGRMSHLDNVQAISSEENNLQQFNHEWSLISRRIFMDHFLDEPLNGDEEAEESNNGDEESTCRMIHLDDLQNLRKFRLEQDESKEMDKFIIKHSKKASEEDDLFHDDNVVFVMRKSMTAVLAKIQRSFDLSQWFETLKKSFGSEQAVNQLLISPIHIIREEEEFLELKSVHHLDSVFVRCDGCSPKDVSAECLYETTRNGWNELMDHIQRSTRCNLFFERMRDLNLYEELYIARPKVNILKEMRCIIIDQMLHYVIDEGNEGWSFVTGKNYIKYNDNMMEPIRKMCSLITKHVPFDNFTLDLGLVNGSTEDALEWKVIELNTILKGITGLGEAEDNIDLTRYDHSFARSEPIVYADQD